MYCSCKTKINCENLNRLKGKKKVINKIEMIYIRRCTRETFFVRKNIKQKVFGRRGVHPGHSHTMLAASGVTLRAQLGITTKKWKKNLILTYPVINNKLNSKYRRATV